MRQIDATEVRRGDWMCERNGWWSLIIKTRQTRSADQPTVRLEELWFQSDGRVSIAEYTYRHNDPSIVYYTKRAKE